LRNGYDILIDAVHGRDVFSDPRLLDLLRCWSSGARTDTVTGHEESVLRVLSRSVDLTLFGFCCRPALTSLSEVDSLMKRLRWEPLPRWKLKSKAGVFSLEDCDYWERTHGCWRFKLEKLRKRVCWLEKGADRNASAAAQCHHCSMQ